MMSEEQNNTAPETPVVGGVSVEKPLSMEQAASSSDYSGVNINEDDGMSWYVVQVYSNFEAKVAESLIEEIERKNFSEFFNAVVVPTEEVIELKRGTKAKVEKKLLPSYILVRMKLSDETWHLVKNTQRVIDFLGSGKVPTAISNREAKRMLRLMQGVDKSGQSRAPRLSVSFSVGEQVRVSDGPFMSFNGIVEDVDEERARLKVSVTIFGRSTPVDLEYTQVDKT